MNIASIDIGSNSVILLIACVDPVKKEFTPLKNYFTTPRISRNLAQGGHFDAGALLRLKKVLKEFKSLAMEYNAESILAVGTEAFRKAQNSAVLLEEIKNDPGIEIRILSGHDEGMLTFAGAASIVPDFEGYVIDIGGASTEIIYGGKDKPVKSESFKFGAVNLFETFQASPPLDSEKINEINLIVRTYLAQFALSTESYVSAMAVAGTPTTLACMDLGIKDFDETIIEGYLLTHEKVNTLVRILAGKTSKEILEEYGPIVEGREDVILTGAIILSTLMETLGLRSLNVSTRGLRHGVILNYITPVI